MASRVLSIEINQVVTKICEIEGKAKNPKVYKSFMVDTPQGVIADGDLHFTDEYVAMLRKALTVNKVKAKKVIFSIASSRIASREVVIPLVKGNKIAEVINAKAEEYFPVDLSDYKVTYSLLGVIEDEKGNKKHKVLVLAAPLKLIQGYYDLAAACGLEIQALDYMGNSLFQAVKNTCVSGTQMVAKIDEHSTLLLIVQDGALVSLRTVAYGVDEAINVLTAGEYNEDYESGTYSYEDAIVALRQSAYIQPGAREDAGAADSVKTVTASLDYLVNGINRVIDFHNPKSNGHPIEKMYITGLGGSFKGMSDLMQEQLGIPVVTIRDIDGLVVTKNFDVTSLGDYIGCIGATMSPLDLVLPTKKEKKQAEKATVSKSGSDNTGLAILIGTGGIMIACVLAVMAMIPYKEAQLENERLKNRIEALQPVQKVHDTYVEAQTLWTDADNMYELTENHNEDLVAFIQELEQKMPSDIIVLSMVASADTVTLNINVSSKASAAKVLQTLDAFESIDIVQTTGLTDVKDLDDVHVVSFSVNCVYAEKQEIAE